MTLGKGKSGFWGTDPADPTQRTFVLSVNQQGLMRLVESGASSNAQHGAKMAGRPGRVVMPREKDTAV